MARRENIFFFVSDILQLINTAYCCSTNLSIIVHLVARGHFLKKQAGRGAESRLFCFLLQRKALPARQSSRQPRKRGLWEPLSEAGTGASAQGGHRAAVAGPERRFLPLLPITPPKAVASLSDDAQSNLGSSCKATDHQAPPHTHESFPLPLSPPPKGLTTGYQENRPPLPVPGAGRSGNSLLITAVVISDFNWQQRELNPSPPRAASSTRQTLSLLGCGAAMRLSILN